MKKRGDHYPLKDGPYSSHSRILSVLSGGRGRHLLDVGCAHGALAHAFNESGWAVLGVEPFAPAAAIARGRGLDVLNAPIEQALEQLTHPFDVIVLADVLEHMEDPWNILRHLAGLLTDDGIIVASIPNIAHLYARFSLMSGKFDYREHGLFDRTHVRFFTRRTSVELFRAANLTVERILPTPLPLERILPHAHSSALGPYMHKVSMLLSHIWPAGLAYQFILIGSRRR